MIILAISIECSNCTYMEYKGAENGAEVYKNISSNCTYMEYKVQRRSSTLEIRGFKLYLYGI